MIKNGKHSNFGLLGDALKVQKISGDYVVKNRRRREAGTVSKKQQEVRDKFLEASQYGSRQTENPDSRELYATGITSVKTSAYMVAMSDYLTPPKVHFIDTESYTGAIGDVITVKATDDFMVVGVKIAILSPDGTRLEEGQAVPDLEVENLWHYETKVSNPALAGTIIRATAVDRPRNKTKLEKVV